MKVLASDYDGTLFIDEHFSQETLESIKRWRSAGNQFGIVTGRDLRMTRDAVQEHQIPFDFLICNNGCVIYDSQCNILKWNYIPDDIIRQLIESPVIARSSYIVLADEKGRYVYDNNYFPGKYPTVYYTQVLTEKDLEHPNYFYQMDTRYKDSLEMDEVTELLTKQFGADVGINPNVCTIDMTPKGVSKLSGLRAYLDIAGLTDAGIITVGDGLNDLPMIEFYRGYTMQWADDRIKDKAGMIITSVSQLIEIELNN